MNLDYDDEAVFKARRYLFDRARERTDEPFMLTVSLIQPHDPYLCPQREWDHYAHEDIDLPRLPPSSAADPSSQRLRHGYGASDLDLDDNTIRNARHAYYGSVSDIDKKVAGLLQVLEESGFKDITIVIFTSDHGDMLGERGMWFRMLFLEHSARVPLNIHAPARYSPRRVRAAVSLVNLLPTLVNMATDDRGVKYVTPMEGRSLSPHLAGDAGNNEGLGEYFAEETDTPLFILRRESTRAIYLENDPLQLFDLSNDPDEINNLAQDPGQQNAIQAIETEITARDNIKALTERVLESQRRRALLKTVMQRQSLAWDHEPPGRASESYIQNSLPAYELLERGRFLSA